VSSQAPLKLAIFDCDGTLVDSRALIVEGMRRSFAERELAIPTDREVMNLVGLPLRVVLQKLANDINEAELDALTDSYRRHFVGLHESDDWRPPLYPDTDTMLDQLVDDMGSLLGIATGKSRKGLVRTLSDCQLSERFATTWTADDGPAKPNPTILEAAMDAVGAYPEECLIVGDTTFDLDMGRNAGMRTVGVPWGNHTVDQLAESQPDLLIESWSEFLAWTRSEYARYDLTSERR
jgi:phosphoglycolate phosphatase